MPPPSAPDPHRLDALPAPIGCGQCRRLWEEVLELRERVRELEERRAEERMQRAKEAAR